MIAVIWIDMARTHHLGPEHLAHAKVGGAGQVSVRDAVAVSIDEQETLDLVVPLRRHALPPLIRKRREPHALPDLQRLSRKPINGCKRDLDVDGDGSQEAAAASVFPDDPHAGDGLLAIEA